MIAGIACASLVPRPTAVIRGLGMRVLVACAHNLKRFLLGTGRMPHPVGGAMGVALCTAVKRGYTGLVPRPHPRERVGPGHETRDTPALTSSY